MRTGEACVVCDCTVATTTASNYVRADDHGGVSRISGPLPLVSSSTLLRQEPAVSNDRIAATVWLGSLPAAVQGGFLAFDLIALLYLTTGSCSSRRTRPRTARG